MKLTKNGYRISKNGNVINSIEKDAIVEDMYLGKMIKDSGIYHFFNRKQGNLFVYLP